MNIRSQIGQIGLLFGCWLLTPLAVAKTDIAWQLSAPARVVEAVRSIPVPPDDQQVGGIAQLELDTQIRMEAGKVYIRQRRAWYFSNNEAIQNYGTETISFNERSDSIVVLTALSVDSAGSTTNFDPEDAQLIDSSTYHVFTNGKELVVPFPNLRVGSITILEYERVIDRSQLETDWSFSSFPQNTFNRQRFRLDIKWDDQNELYWGSSSKHVTCESTAHSVSCLGEQIPPAELDAEVIWRDLLGQIVVSDAGQWPGIVSEIRRSFDTALEDSAGLDALVEHLTGDAESVKEKISRIHEFVARDIRYVSVSRDGHSTVPHTITETLENRFGDCKDKSALLVALLNRLEIAAVPVLVATDRSVPAAMPVPSSNYFNHMVVCFKLGEEQFCLDATDAYTTWQAIPPWIQGRVALGLSAGSTPTTIPESQYLWQFGVESSVRFSADGGQQEQQQRIYKSEYAGVRRSALAGKTSDAAQRWMLEEYQEVVSTLAEPVFEVTGLDQIGAPVSIDSVATYKAFVDVDQDLEYSESDAWLRSLVKSLRLENQVYDSRFPGLKVTSVYELDISSLWQVSGTGANLNLEHEYGLMTRHISLENDGLVRVTTELKIPMRHVAVESADEFNQFLSLISRESLMHIYGILK